MYSIELLVQSKKDFLLLRETFSKKQKSTQQRKSCWLHIPFKFVQVIVVGEPTKKNIEHLYDCKSRHNLRIVLLTKTK